MVPLSGVSKPAIRRKAVDLPQPLGPRRGDEFARLDGEAQMGQRRSAPHVPIGIKTLSDISDAEQAHLKFCSAPRMKRRS